MKKAVRRTLVFFAGAALVAALAAGSLLLPGVQSFIGRKVSQVLSRHIPQELSVGRIDIRPSGRVLLEDLLLLDHRGDTLIAADSVRARIGLRGLFRGDLSLACARVDGLRMNVVKYPGDTLNSLAVFTRNFPRKKKEDRKPFFLKIGRAGISRGEFSFQDRTAERYYAAHDVSIAANGLSIAPGDYRVEIDSLRLRSSEGLELQRLSGAFRAGEKGLVADKVVLNTARSRLRFSAAAYLPPGDSASTPWKDKLRRMQFSLSVDPSHIDPGEAENFFPAARALPPTDLSARIIAQEHLLDIRELKISMGNVFSADLSGRIDSPGALRQGEGKIVVKSLRLAPVRAIAVMNAVSGKYLPKKTYDRLSAIEHLSGSALVNLKDEDVTAVASLTTPSHGKIFLRAASADLWSRRNARYTARAVLERIDAGLLSGSEDLGALTLLADIRGQGFDLSSARAEISASIPLLEFKGYSYTGIGLSARLREGTLTAETAVEDPNLVVKASAEVRKGASREDPLQGSLDIYLDKSDLHALGLVRDSIVNVRGTIQAQAQGKNLDDLTGTLSFSEMSYNSAGRYYYIDRILVQSQAVDSLRRRLSVESDGLFDGYIEGNYLLSQVPAAIANGLLSGFKTYRKKTVTPGQRYDFQLNIAASNVKVVNTPLVFDGQTHLGGKVDTSQDDFSFDILADRINYRNILVDTLQFRLNTANANVLSVKAQKFINPVYSIEDLDFSALRYADSLALRSDFRKWNSPDSIAFHLNAYLRDDTQGDIVLGILPSSIDLERMKWRLGSPGAARDRVIWNVEQGLWRIDSLSLVSGAARMSANGYYTPRDSMDIRLNVHSLDLARTVRLRNNVPLQGRLNARVHLSKASAESTPIPEASLNIDSLAVGSDRIGDLDLAVKADLPNRYVNTSARLIHGAREALSLRGGLHIVPEQGLVPEIDIALDSLPLDGVHYLLPTVFNRSAGYASAQLAVRGTMKSPQINGAVRLDGTRLGIKFTNVEYIIPDGTQVPVRNSFFYFEDIRARDAIYATQATLRGRIYHDNFRPWYLDLRADADRTLVLNTSGEGEEKFYGRVFATGYMKLQGPTNALKYDIAARTERNTFFAIDIGGTSDFKDSPMITFVPPKTSHVDSLLADLKKKIVRSAPETSSEMNIDIQATPEATLALYLDKTSGHMIEASGQGGVSMRLSPKGTFTLNGNYQTTGGTYTFVYQNLIKRSFTLLSGGRITFDGDPSNPSLDLSASYKTTVKPAVYLSSVAENAREEVVTTIHLTGDLMNPVYNFDIQMPRAPENVREELAYRLSDQEQLNQQFISLMALNSFTATGENDNQNVVATGVTGLTAGMLSSQFSNILQRFVQGVDINVNLNTSSSRYVEAHESTDFEVGISTKLFDDRVTVNGVVGVPTGTTQSDLAGDVEIEYNISPDGRLRAVFVNRRQNDYLNNQQGYMQSVGISYRQEFNTLRELGRLIKQSLSGKNAAERKKARAERKAEKIRRKAASPLPQEQAPRPQPVPGDTTRQDAPPLSLPDTVRTTSLTMPDERGQGPDTVARAPIHISFR